MSHCRSRPKPKSGPIISFFIKRPLIVGLRLNRKTMDFVGNLVFFPFDIFFIVSEVLVDGIGYLASILVTLVSYLPHRRFQ